MLAHRETDVLGKVYDLYEGLDEKRRALKLWAGYVDNLLSPKPPNVAQFPRAAAE